jgi:hypothetical protein
MEERLLVIGLLGYWVINPDYSSREGLIKNVPIVSGLILFA